MKEIFTFLLLDIYTGHFIVTCSEMSAGNECVSKVNNTNNLPLVSLSSIVPYRLNIQAFKRRRHMRKYVLSNAEVFSRRKAKINLNFKYKMSVGEIVIYK